MHHVLSLRDHPHVLTLSWKTGCVTLAVAAPLVQKRSDVYHTVSFNAFACDALKGIFLVWIGSAVVERRRLLSYISYRCQAAFDMLNMADYRMFGRKQTILARLR